MQYAVQRTLLTAIFLSTPSLFMYAMNGGWVAVYRDGSTHPVDGEAAQPRFLSHTPPPQPAPWDQEIADKDMQTLQYSSLYRYLKDHPEYHKPSWLRENQGSVPSWEWQYGCFCDVVPIYFIEIQRLLEGKGRCFCELSHLDQAYHIVRFLLLVQIHITMWYVVRKKKNEELWPSVHAVYEKFAQKFQEWASRINKKVTLGDVMGHVPHAQQKSCCNPLRDKTQRAWLEPINTWLECCNFVYLFDWVEKAFLDKWQSFGDQTTSVASPEEIRSYFQAFNTTQLTIKIALKEHLALNSHLDFKDIISKDFFNDAWYSYVARVLESSQKSK